MARQIQFFSYDLYINDIIRMKKAHCLNEREVFLRDFFYSSGVRDNYPIKIDLTRIKESVFKNKHHCI